MLTGCVTADEANGFNGRVITNRIDGWYLAVDDVENTVREAWLFVSQHCKIEPSVLPAFLQSSAMIIAAPGSRSEGLTIRVFPVTIAIGIDQRGIILHDSQQAALGTKTA